MRGIQMNKIKALIVNASALHHSEKEGTSLWQFAFLKILSESKLTDEELLKLFNNQNNWSMLMDKRMLIALDEVRTIRSSLERLIGNYKLGSHEQKMETAPFAATNLFVNSLLEDFFPKLAEINYPNQVKQRIFAQRELYLCLHGKKISSEEELDNKDISFCLD